MFAGLTLQFYHKRRGWVDGQPIVQRISDDEVKLRTHYRARWLDDAGDEDTVEVEKGFTCDLSSIPRVFQRVVPKVGLHDGPSIVHDWCYVHLWRTRAATDRLFLESMRVVGVHWLRRHIIYLAVRAGGWVLWNRRTRRRGL